jgi:dienelactone hydrolase
MSDEMGRRDFLKRGTTAGVAAMVGLPAAAVDSPPALVHHAPSSAAARAARRFDSKEFCLSEHASIAPSMSFTARGPAAAVRWQRRARQRLVQRLGGFPSVRVPLDAEVVQSVDFGSYTREHIVFDTRSNLSATGYLLLPKDRPKPLPAIVCFSGHGRGVTDIIGLGDDGAPRAERGVGYAKEYALRCVEHGYATFAVEQLGFGARRDDAARRAGPNENSCRPAACSALLFGQSMAGWRVWDAMRSIDYLQTRPEVDSARIATLGASGGGTTSLLTAAVDERVRVSVVSAYFNTFRDSIISISHCPDNYVPGIATDMEMHDIAGLVAPRGLFVESGRGDRIFPIAGSMRAAEEARRIYEAFARPERFGYQVHEGAHEFHGVGAFDFLSRWL